MPKKNNITVSRYKASEAVEGANCADGSFPWEASVEPADSSWVLFIPKDPAKLQPQLWFRVGTHDNGDGTGQDAFAPAGSAEHLAFLSGEKVDLASL